MNDLEKYIKITPIETLIKHELFYQLNIEKERTSPHDNRQIPLPSYWAITFESNEQDRDGFYIFFDSKSPHRLFKFFKKK